MGLAFLVNPRVCQISIEAVWGKIILYKWVVQFLYFMFLFGLFILSRGMEPLATPNICQTLQQLSSDFISLYNWPRTYLNVPLSVKQITVRLSSYHLRAYRVGSERYIVLRKDFVSAPSIYIVAHNLL